MTPNRRFFVVAALVLAVPLFTFLFAQVPMWDSENLLEQLVAAAGASVGLWGYLLMIPPAMLDSAVLGGSYFSDELLGSAPRGGSGWAFYLFFYLMVALAAGLFGSSRRAPRHNPGARLPVPPRGAAVDLSRSSHTPRVAAQAGRSLLGSPLRKVAALTCALIALWLLPPLRSSPTVGRFNRDGFPRQCEGERLYLRPSARAPELVERLEPIYSEGARQSKIKGVAHLSLAVLVSGKVCGAKVDRGLNPEVDASILAAVEKWRFKPGTYEGAPVAVATHVVVRVDFRDPSPGELRRAEEKEATQRRAAERKAREVSGPAPGP